MTLLVFVIFLLGYLCGREGCNWLTLWILCVLTAALYPVLFVPISVVMSVILFFKEKKLTS
jgi:hypothetical protein